MHRMVRDGKVRHEHGHESGEYNIDRIAAGVAEVAWADRASQRGADADHGRVRGAAAVS